MAKRITLDTHTLIWYIHKPSRGSLSANALKAIRQAVVDGRVYIPTITLLEVLRLIEKGRYPISFKNLMNAIKLHKAFEIIPLTVEIVELSERLSNRDIHDRVIVSTAIYTDTELVCLDIEISKVYDRVIW
jgi:PIN domain nuclease of toxin-antitoxin system